MTNATLSSGAKGARHVADAVLAALVLLIVGMMVIPLPTTILDLLIAGNLSVAVVMLLVAMHISGGLQFASFPTVLLITTLYRLALNVSSTRLILLQADAGEIIRSFGSFVVRGNYVVGAVVFLIITLIQFLVIAKGSERVAEVGARFTLDAMPGKQMSIDAELRNGSLSSDEARVKRAQLQRESQFFGAMDGAMKFVKGDAIAGLVITAINIVGGLAVGISLHDLKPLESLELYGLLTIGDGLVSQIPALLISTSAGLVVTRVSSEAENRSLGRDVAAEIFGQPKALAIASAFLLALGLVPGLPLVPFLALSALSGGLAYRLWPTHTPEDASRGRGRAGARTLASDTWVRQVAPLEIELGAELAAELHGAPPASPPPLERDIAKLREEIFLDLGVVLPDTSIAPNPRIAPRHYRILADEVVVGENTVPGGQSLIVAATDIFAALDMTTRQTTDPVTGAHAYWVPTQHAAMLTARGLSPLGPEAVVLRHLRHIAQTSARRWLGVQEVQHMLDELSSTHPALIRSIVPKPVSLVALTEILSRLVHERISIRPFVQILEVLAVHAQHEQDVARLSEQVRSSLREHITQRYSDGGVLRAYVLDPSIEEAIRDSTEHGSTKPRLALPPDLAREITDAIRRRVSVDYENVVLLTQPDVRWMLRSLIEVDLPQVAVLSYDDVAPEATVEARGHISL